MTEPINDGKKTVDRGAGGRFVPGNKASKGRQPGPSPVAELRRKLSTDLDAIVGVLRAQALAGDQQAIRIILDKVQPSPRAVEEPVVLDMPEGGTLAQQAQHVVQAAADGEIAPSQAAQLITALGSVAKIVETTELLQRIEALEAQNKVKGKT